MLLSEILIQLASDALKKQLQDGSMPEGHNGPWHDTDTRVRTTAHWGITFHRAWELTGKEPFREASINCCIFLMSETARPFGKTFYCRVSSEMGRKQNGLIGQAWALETLIEIGKKENHLPFIQSAVEVFLLHPYSYTLHGWQNIFINGEVGPFDTTLNQQIWFGTMGSKLGHFSQEIRSQCADFFSSLVGLVAFVLPGLISHHVKSPRDNWNSKIRQFLNRQVNPSAIEHEKILSQGYQSFILFALFTYLQDSGEEPDIFSFLRDPLDFSLDRKKSTLYKTNPYCYGYNMTGIELAFVAENMGDFEAAGWWLNQQFRHTYDHSENEFLTTHVADTVVSTARIYETTRLSNEYEIHV